MSEDPKDDRQDPDIQGSGDLLPEPSPPDRKGAGGTHTHKPGCRCNPCSARARLEEALAESAGGGGTALATIPGQEEPLNADDMIVATPARGTRRPTLAKKAIIAEWIKLRTIEPEITNTESARRMGITRQYLQKVIRLGAREGWLVFDDPLQRVEHLIIPKVVDNLNAFLDAKDRQVTLEVAKGTLFKQFQESKGLAQGGNVTVLALKIELPQTENAQLEIVEGQIVGRPKIDIDSNNS